MSAELVADRWQLSRAELDEYSAQSHHRAAAAWESGHFAGEVIAVPEAPSLARDETVRPGTTAEGLAALRPSFRTSEFAARFPELDWKITPGNSSPLTDGASAVLICSATKARQLGLRPRARFLAFSVTGDDPLLMLTGPIPATRNILRRTGLTIDDLDAYEVNEAFAPVPLAWMRESGADPRAAERARRGDRTRARPRLFWHQAPHHPAEHPRIPRRPLRTADDVRSRRHGQRNHHRTALNRLEDPA